MGREGRGREGRGSIETQLGSCDFLGGEERGGEGRGGGSIDTQLGSCDFLGVEEGRGGEGGSIDTQLGKDPQRLWKDHLCQCWSWGGGGVDQHSTWKGSTKTLEGICKNFWRIASANADPWRGSINTQLGKDPQRLWKDHLCQCWSWGGQSTLNLERIHKDFGRIASANADPRGGGQSTLNLERICKYFGRITSANADPGGGVNQHSTWKGSAKTLEGLPLPMLILGGSWSTLNLERIRKDFGRNLQRLWKDRLCQCWSLGGGRSTLNLERIRKDFGRIASANADPGGGGDWHSTWKGSAKTLEGLPLPMLILGVTGVNRHSTWKGSAKTLEGLPLPMLILGGWVNWHSTWKGSTKTLEGSPLPMLILGGGVDRHSTWKGSAKTLEGSPLPMLILGVVNQH